LIGKVINGSFEGLNYFKKKVGMIDNLIDQQGDCEQTEYLLGKTVKMWNCKIKWGRGS